MDDPVAIKRCQAGDKDAFRFLVERYQAEAVGHALAILTNREDALDAVQEAFLDAYHALGRFDTARQFYPWFYTILRNRCFKLVGRRKDVGLSLDDTSILAPVNEIPAEDRLALERALLELSSAEREIVTLKHLDGLSYNEIAERLEIPKGTVMSRVFNARKHQREKLTLRKVQR
jgi:RNA polymerase sigma-70 factor (ECF subfamily)